jgi:hypothetical protein
LHPKGELQTVFSTEGCAEGELSTLMSAANKLTPKPKVATRIPPKKLIHRPEF